LLAAVKNFEITKKVFTEFKSKKEDFNKEYIGNLMNEHHSYLRDYLDISTPKIERMIEAATEAGAVGCKITGSGNGGCMIAYAPGKEREVSKAIQQAGGVVYPVSIAPGVGRDK
jgi:galactokinase